MGIQIVVAGAINKIKDSFVPKAEVEIFIWIDRLGKNTHEE